MSLSAYQLPLSFFARWFAIATLVLIGTIPSSVFAQQENAPSLGTQQTPMPYVVEALLGNENEVFGDFVVGPGKIELQIEPGQSKMVEVTVSNRTGVPRTFEIAAEDAVGSTDPNQNLILLGDDRGPYSLKDYISVEATRFELGHNERARIPVTVTLPPNAEPGGLYGSLLISTVSTEAKSGDEAGTQPQSAIVARIGTLFFITIPGDVAKSGRLANFATIPEKKFYQEGPITFGVLYENTGSVHLTPFGEVRIKNILGEEVGVVTLEPWFILPQSLRLREVTWDREFLFGRYIATVSIDDNYSGEANVMTYTFWVLPWKPIAVAFLGIFLVIFLIRTFFKKFEFKRKEESV